MQIKPNQRINLAREFLKAGSEIELFLILEKNALWPVILIARGELANA
jgi:hypothetical protein